MSRLKAYFFLVIVMSFTFSQVLIVASFLSNQEFITNNLCENIDRPELECNGKCFLMKKLKEDEEQKGKDQVVSSEVIFFINNQQFEVKLPKEFADVQEFLISQIKGIQDGYSIAVFHPPIFSI